MALRPTTQHQHGGWFLDSLLRAVSPLWTASASWAGGKWDLHLAPQTKWHPKGRPVVTSAHAKKSRPNLASLMKVKLRSGSLGLNIALEATRVSLGEHTGLVVRPTHIFIQWNVSFVEELQCEWVHVHNTERLLGKPNKDHAKEILAVWKFCVLTYDFLMVYFFNIYIFIIHKIKYLCNLTATAINGTSFGNEVIVYTTTETSIISSVVVWGHNRKQASFSRSSTSHQGQNAQDH